VQELTVSVAEIIGRPGQYRDISITKPVPGLEVPLAHVGERPLAARLRLESVVEGILVTGGVEAVADLECARCLKGLTESVEVDVCELYTAPGHEAEDDAYRVTGMDIDLEPMLRDAVTLALPLNPVCRADCAGLCARCGKDLNEGACDCTEDTSDPRWAPLAALRDKLESNAG
jgi:uncharacterized metal-binding protein YceD (DUF177 family)